MYSEERVKDYIIRGKELLKNNDSSKDTTEMQGFAKEICETYRTDLTEFTIYIENWNDKPILLKKIIEKLEDWVDSHQIMIGGI